MIGSKRLAYSERKISDTVLDGLFGGLAGGVAMALYPLSAFRAMNAAALRVYEAIRKDGTQKGVVELMQTRDDLYDYLDYHAYEQKLDSLFARDRKK